MVCRVKSKFHGVVPPSWDFVNGKAGQLFRAFGLRPHGDQGLATLMWAELWCPILDMADRRFDIVSDCMLASIRGNDVL
jgi:hypothetical protein